MNQHPKQSIVLAVPPLAATPSREGPTSFSEAFLDKVEGQYFIDSLVHGMVETAAHEHVQRVNDSIAVDYTAVAIWAEMVALVKNSVVPHDPGYRSAAEAAAAEGSRTIATQYHDPWRAGDPPARLSTEEHSRRVVDVRAAVPKPENAQLNGTRRRKVADSTSSRPVSGQSISVDDNGARALLSGIRSNSVKPASRGSVDHSTLSLSVPGGRSVSAASTPPSTNVKLHRGQSNKILKTASPRGASEPPTLAVAETLSQPDTVTDDSEIQLHRDAITRITAERDESVKKAQKIAKALSDPKSVPKNFTIDINGAVIPISSVDEGRVASLAEATSPRYQLPSNAPPPPPVDPAAAAGGKQRPGRAAFTHVAKNDTSEKRKAPRDGKKEESFLATDARDVPMQIRVAPAGGVVVKDNGPPRMAELKTPSTKMSKAEFARQRGVYAVPDTPANAFGLQSQLASSDAPGGPAGEAIEARQLLESPSSLGQLPVKRGAVPQPKKSDTKAETARKPAPPTAANTNAASARPIAQAPAPPPKRDGHNSAINSRKTQIDKAGITPRTDTQLSTLADTWHVSKAHNKEREGVRVTVGRGGDALFDTI